MPNGNLGGGLGTQSSPFEIWDVHDLNALRGLPTSNENRIYIRFKADIDFRVTPFADLFTTIRFANNLAATTAWDFVDIDGEGHTLRNFRQTGASIEGCGLFRYIDGSIRNLNIHCNSHYAFGSVSSGVLAQFARTTLIENIKITGTLTVANTAVSGLVHTIHPINNTTPVLISNCIVNLRVDANAGFNGFFGTMLAGAGNTVILHRCVSANNVYCGTANVTIGGFFSAASTNGTVILDSCISECYFAMLTEAQQFTGIVAGFRASTAGITMQAYINCISKCKFDGMPPATANNMSAFAPNNIFTVVRCYAACQYDLKSSAANIRGGDGIALFDWEQSGLPFNRFTDGAAVGVTTEQLQSKSFLESRGWIF